VSGPLDIKDVPDVEPETTTPPTVVVSDSRVAAVGAIQVRRALPNRGRRTVGAWCFADHFGPLEADESHRPDIGPHPHMGLQTVTWLLDGELLHRDSLGSEQMIRPGQLNLMTAGHGVAHAEEATNGYRGPIHGVQLWVAQPGATRDGGPAFEHHPELPHIELINCDATVLVGEMSGSASPARRDTQHVGVDLNLRGPTAVPLEPAFEYALIVLDGAVSLEGTNATPGHLVYLGSGRDELAVWSDREGRVLLLGGSPFEERLLMWWNFVARSRDEIDRGYHDWTIDSGRFGRVASSLPRIEADRPIWMQPSS